MFACLFNLFACLLNLFACLFSCFFVCRTYPILLQGPTSAGKTSLIQYVAQLLGHECLRVNNHEHTDLQEYVGAYTTTERGELVFQEGEELRERRERVSVCEPA